MLLFYASNAVTLAQRAVRLRAWEDGIGLQALDRELKTGGYFHKNGAYNKTKGYVNIGHIRKAVEFFGVS